MIFLVIIVLFERLIFFSCCGNEIMSSWFSLTLALETEAERTGRRLIIGTHKFFLVSAHKRLISAPSLKKS